MQMRDFKSDITEIAGTLSHVGMWMTAGLSDVVYKNPNYKNDMKGVAIYCVHGTADRTLAFSTIINIMLKENQGLPSLISSIHVPAFDYRLQGLGVNDFALQLKEKIKLNQHKQVIFVGHSRGGLVGSYYTEYLAEEAGVTVLGVFPIASPFGGGSQFGTTIFSGISKSVNQMQTLCTFLNDLCKRVLVSKVPYEYLAALDDLLVSEDAASPLGHAQYRRTFSGAGHLTIMQKPLVALFLQLKIQSLVKGLKLEEDEKPTPTLKAKK